MNNKTQIKSRKRVNNYGEVFTNPREVNAMLDLVKQETERIDSRFLEPACGSGNFLVEVIKRKLNVVKSIYGKCQNDYDRYSLIAVTSIYGIDILQDNVDECRMNLYNVYLEKYKSMKFKSIDKDLIKSIEFILSKNIILGDALTLKSPDGLKPIIFSEWSAVNGNLIKRRDFTLAELLENAPFEEYTLFSDNFEEIFIPRPIREYDLVHYLKVGDFHE